MTRRLRWMGYGVGALALACAAAFAVSLEWSVERTYGAVRATGWAAIVTLALSLCASPVGRALGRLSWGPSGAEVTAARRSLGISAGALAAVHLTLALTTLLDGALWQVLEVTWLRAGATAALILGLLWLTSYPRVVKGLRIRLWKPLHRLVYVAALLAVQHAVMAPMASDPTWLLVLGAVVLALAPLRLLPRRARAPRRPNGGAGE